MENNPEITVIDSIMGSRKTTYAMQKVKSNPEANYIYVTPFLTEVDRLKEFVGRELKEGDTILDGIMYDERGEVVNRPYKIKSLTQKNQGKLKSFKNLVTYGHSIVTTHSLMSMFDLEIQETLRVGEYHLILDEVVDVIHQYNWSSISDKKTFFEDLGGIGEDGYLFWDEEKNPPHEYTGRFSDIMTLCINKNLLTLNDSQEVYLWEFPIEVFKVFKSVTILTFMFNGSYQKTYFDLFDVKYNYKSMRDGELVDYEAVSIEDRKRLKSLITIEDSKSLNDIGEGFYNLSSSWLKKHVKNGTPTVDHKKLKANILNYFKNRVTTNSKLNMRSTLAPYKGKLSGKWLQKDSYLSILGQLMSLGRKRV